MLNAIWIGFLLVAAATGFWEATAGGRPAVLGEMTKASFDMAKTAFEISLGLTGVMALWLGLLRVGERAGITAERFGEARQIGVARLQQAFDRAACQRRF